MKAARKPTVTKPKAKAVNKTQINTSLPDPSEVSADPSPAISPTAVHVKEITVAKKANYFSLKLNNNLASTPAASKFSLHQRHYSLNQSSNNFGENSAPPTAQAANRYKGAPKTKATGVYLRHSFQKPHSITSHPSPKGRENLVSKNITLVPNAKRPKSSKVPAPQSFATNKGKGGATPIINASAKRVIASIKLGDSAKKSKGLNVTAISPSAGILAPTINNFVNITTISGAPVSNFVTIPAKLRDSYFLNPVLQKTPTNETKTVVPPGKKRLTVKTSEQRKKRAVPAKSEKHSKQHSLNTSIGDLLKSKKPTIGDPGFKNVKVKDLTEMHSRKSQYRVVVTKYAFYSKVGQNPANPAKQNQDSFIIHPKISGSYSQHLFGVADGHGQYGKEVSNTVKQKYPGLLEHYLKSHTITDALIKASVQTNKEIEHLIEDIEFSGTTCVMVLINGQELYTANIGDSRAILCSYEGGGKPITRDHKPDEPDEAARILSQGGRIEPFKDINGDHVGPLRVWQRMQDIPGLAMTRALGDGAGVIAGVICTPEIFKFGLNKSDKFLVIASDGIWEFLANQEVAEIVYPYYENNDAEAAADALVKEANRRWTEEEDVIDDITCIVIFLESIII